MNRGNAKSILASTTVYEDQNKALKLSPQNAAAIATEARPYTKKRCVQATKTILAQAEDMLHNKLLLKNKNF